MKLYDSKASNPRRVRIFLAEKGMSQEVTIIPVSLSNGEHRTEEFKAINPFTALPVLELENGTVIAESTSICRYLEMIYPEIPLLGASALEQAQVDMWSRRIESAIMSNAMTHFHFGTDGLNPKAYKNKNWANFCAERINTSLPIFNSQLQRNDFIAGDFFSLADITLLCALDLALFLKVIDLDKFPAIKNWHTAASQRESSKA